MSENPTSNPFKYSKRCPLPIQKNAKKNKQGLIAISIIGIILIASMSVFLYYGMESTIYFKLNEYDSEGNPIGQILAETEYPQEPFKVVEGSNIYTLASSNITSASIRAVGFIFIEKNFLERLILDDNNFTLFFIAMSLKFQSIVTVSIPELVEGFDSIIPYWDYTYNNSVTWIMGNFINNKYNDLIWKFQANSYCIPLFNIQFTYIDPSDNVTIQKSEISGCWTKLLTTRDIQDAQLGRGVYEMRITDIQYNSTLIDAYNTNDLATILTATRPMCYFESAWAYRNWFYDGVSVFKPVDQQK